MFGTVLGILSAIVSAGVGIYSAYQSKKQQDLAEKTSTENFNLQQQQFEYQKELNQTVMEREDTSMQRQVADLKEAGLSPLAVTNGASATPLTSANAPQRDISGMNEALQNMLGAYNDIFNRRLARQQFALQSKVQKAQMYTQLAELEMKQKTAEKQNKLLDLDYTYYLNHPERNLGLQSVLVNGLERLLTGNFQLPGNIQLPNISENKNKGLFNLIPKSEETTQFNFSSILPKNNQPRTVSQEMINSDLSKIEKAQKKRVDSAIVSINLKKDFENNAKTIWEYTNVKDYFKDYDTFYVTLAAQKNKYKYLENMNIAYKPRERLKLGQ